MDAVNHEWHWTMLMEQSLDGDADAYRRLLTLLTPALRRAVRSRARPVGMDEEDVVQEVLLALHLKRGTWRRGTPIAPWVAAIARNKLIDAYRRRGRRVEIGIDQVLETLHEDDTQRDEQAHDIGRMLERLSARQRSVLRCVSLEGYSAREAASRLQMSEVAVRVTLHRGLKTLAALFRNDDHENG